MRARALQSLALAVAVVALGAAPTAEADVLTWQDPGFESSTDLTSGPWTAASMEIDTTEPDKGDHAEWAIDLQPSGGNPAHHVYVHEQYAKTRGYGLVGQHIEVPVGSVVTAADLAMDALRYCPNADRRGDVGFLLLTAEEWARIHPVQAHPPKRNEVHALWSEPASGGIAGDDVTSWTDPEAHVTTSDPMLGSALQSLAGRDLVLAAYYYGAHRSSAEWGRLDNFQATITYTPTDLIVMPWRDPGFDFTTDFASGPWEVREARLNASYDSEWSFSVQADGGFPGAHVSIDDTPNTSLGSALLGQHVYVPPANDVVSVAVELDLEKYCSHASRGGGLTFALLPAAEWDKMDPALSGSDTPMWDDIAASSYWWTRVFGAASPDYTDWTHYALATADAAAIEAALNAHKGEDVVLAVGFEGWHAGNDEWARIDNFQARIFMTPEPATLALLAGGLIALRARRRRRAR